MKTMKPKGKSAKIVLRCDEALKERAEIAAKKAYGGNVSIMTREALEKEIERVRAIFEKAEAAA